MSFNLYLAMILKDMSGTGNCELNILNGFNPHVKWVQLADVVDSCVYVYLLIYHLRTHRETLYETAWSKADIPDLDMLVATLQGNWTSTVTLR